MACLKYYAKKDSIGFPIPGTQMGYVKDPCNCDLVLLEATDTFTGVNDDDELVEQAFHPNRLRYFVRIDCDNQEVLPNSLFTSLIHPGGNVAEFKKTFIAS